MQTSISFDHGLGLEVYTVTYPEAAPPRIKVHKEPTRRSPPRRSARLAAKEQERIAKEQERIAKEQERMAKEQERMDKLSFVKKAMEEARIKSSEDMLLATLSKADRAKQTVAAMLKASKEACLAWQRP
jgi:hypothetical protein